MVQLVTGKAGLIRSASPEMLLGGGLVLLVISAMLFLATRIAKKGGGHDFIETAGYVVGGVGLVAIYGGLFGWVWPPWN